MKALVLGGNRYFGKQLVSLLLQRGAKVTVLNRGQRPDEFGDRVQRIRMDRKNISKAHPDLANQKWDVVYDLICYDALEAKGACEAFEGKTNHYVFISSQSVYPPGNDILECSFDPKSHKFASPIASDKDYGEAKRQAEATFFQTNAFPTTAVRFPIVLGEDDYTERLKKHVKWIQAGQPIFFPNLDAKISFIQSSDAAKFLLALADRPFLGPVNCCAAEPIALKELIHEIECALGKYAKIAAREQDGQPSPFGAEADWYMNTRKMREYGFIPEPIQKWLPGLIQKLK
ncbi:MAG TPA: NAD-dependent epimerase/dehydratase family protein [Bdellovibrionota bacterium]|jgi:nucleoside-diphosphate-sugar epimerase